MIGHVVKLKYRGMNKFYRIFIVIILLIITFLVFYLIADTRSFKILINRGTISTQAWIFLTANALRIFMLLACTFFIFRKSKKTKLLLLLAIIVETSSLAVNYFLPIKALTLLWPAVSFFTILLLFFALHLFFKGYLLVTPVNRNEGSYDAYGNPAPAPAHSSFSMRRLMVTPERKVLKPIVIPIIIVILLMLLIYGFKDRILAEVKYFFTQTRFLSDSGIDRLVKRMPTINKMFSDGRDKKGSLLSKHFKKLRDSLLIKDKYTDKIPNKAKGSKSYYYERGHAFLSRKEYKRSVIEFEKALKSPLPKYTKMLTHYFLAVTYEKNLRMTKRALKHWKHLKNMPEHRVKYQINFPKIAKREVQRLNKLISKSKRRKHR